MMPDWVIPLASLTMGWLTTAAGIVWWAASLSRDVRQLQASAERGAHIEGRLIEVETMLRALADRLERIEHKLDAR